MNSAKNFRTLNPLIESEGGLHFSAYIANYFGAPSVREQLVEALKVASEDTRPVLNRDERKKFLKPLHALLTDRKTISTIRGNIGIFRSKNFFRVMHVPVHVEEYATVASSFHVKPLLRWAQEDRAFRLAIVGEKMTCLYSGSQHSLRHIDTFVQKKSSRIKSFVGLSNFWKKQSLDKRQAPMRELLVWLEEQLSKDSSHYTPPLFIVGSNEILDFVSQHLSYADIRVMYDFNQCDHAKIVTQIRHSLREETKDTIRAKLYDFKIAEALDLAESNVHKIAKAAKQGLVKKLIVAADKKLFGKIAQKSGRLTLHPADIDHEDEDILDDIAQAVVRRGGEVMVAPTSKIPGGHPALAITEAEDPFLYNKNTFNVRYERGLVFHLKHC